MRNGHTCDQDLARVAARDSQRLPDGPWAVAEVEGEALAVLSLNSGAFVADPFSRTVELRALLELRAKQLRAREGSRRGVARAARHRVARSPAGALGRAGTLAARPRA